MKISERGWVSGLKTRLEAELAQFDSGDESVKVSTEKWLYYAQEVMGDGPTMLNPENNQYRVDLLIYGDTLYGKIPRVAVEIKLNTVTTNDAIAYNEKARRHKLVYPYLRYGVLVANWGESPLPARLVREGRDLEFAFLVRGRDVSADEWGILIDLLGQEVMASRQLHTFLAQNRKANKSAAYRYIHHRLNIG